MALDETAQLVEAAVQGEGSARGALLERLRPRIVLWATTRLSSLLRAKVEPEDVAQEVLVAVYKGFDGYEHRDHHAFLAWLFRVAENRIRDLADHFGAQKRQAPDPVVFSQTSASTAAVLRERVDRVREALALLPPDYQEVIRLRRLQELDCAQVAEIMGRSENAVRVLYCRALKALGLRMKTIG